MIEPQLRQMISDPRYRARSAEGDRYRASVGRAFQERYPGDMPRDATGRQIDGERTIVSVRAYDRRGENNATEHVSAHQRGAPRRQHAAPVGNEWFDQPNRSWREAIAEEESRGSPRDFGYGARNGLALGRYQLLPDAMTDAGWLHEGRWAVRARASGVSSAEEFLANPSAQEQALNDIMRRNEQQLAAFGTYRFVGRQFQGFAPGQEPFTVTEAGLAAAAHREGAQGTTRFLRHVEAGRPQPPSIANRRGDRSVFNEVERRLRKFAQTEYRSVLRP